MLYGSKTAGGDETPMASQKCLKSRQENGVGGGELGQDGGIAVCVCIVSCFIYHIILRILLVRLSHGKHIIVMGKNVIIRIAIGLRG